MSRLIFLILLGFVANWWWRNLHRQRNVGSRPNAGASADPNARQKSGSPFSRGASKPAALPEPMVRCAYCDTYLPVSEATTSGGQHFCHPRHAHDFATRAAQRGDAR